MREERFTCCRTRGRGGENSICAACVGGMAKITCRARNTEVLSFPPAITSTSLSVSFWLIAKTGIPNIVVSNFGTIFVNISPVPPLMRSC